MNSSKRLTARQALFVREYLIDSNASRAALACGSKKGTARNEGCRLLRAPAVQAEIQRLTAARARKLDITADAVLQELAKLAFSNVQDFVRLDKDGTPHIDLSTATREEWAAIESLQTQEEVRGRGKRRRLRLRNVKLKMNDKPTALRMLGQHLRLLGGESEGARLGVQVIIGDIPRPNRPAIDVSGNGRGSNGDGST